jgi:hypothetical protein
MIDKVLQFNAIKSHIFIFCGPKSISFACKLQSKPITKIVPKGKEGSGIGIN